MKRASICIAIITSAIVTVSCTSEPVAPSAVSLAGPTLAKGGRPAAAGVVYVSSQGLYYDTFVTKDPLPMEGRFQLLENGVAEFGPGDAGYLGGRWWEDTNGNGIQDPTDHYFLCPLLPPGRTSP